MLRIGAFGYLVALFAAASVVCAASKPVNFVPVASTGTPRLDGKVWTVDTEHYGARFALLDTATRREWLLRQTGSATDPFASPPDAPATFLTFLLDLECRGTGRIYFQPISTRLIPPGANLRNPLDIATIHSAFGILEKQLPPAYETILSKVLLERNIDLAPGAHATGLLAFRASDLGLRRFRIEIRFSGPDGEELGFDASYVAAKSDDETKKK